MPRGGARAGAGRPKGRKNSLPLVGLGITLDAARIASKRLAADKDATPEDHAELAKVYQVVGKVLNCKVHPLLAGHAIQAARILAEAIAAPRVQKVEHSLADQHAAMVFAAIAPAQAPVLIAPAQDPLRALAEANGDEVRN